jgi:hypothetical protein
MYLGSVRIYLQGNRNPLKAHIPEKNDDKNNYDNNNDVNNNDVNNNGSEH